MKRKIQWNASRHYKKGWDDCASQPQIAVSEISRILVNYRKNLINNSKKCKIIKYPHALDVVAEIRKALELRRRSREKTRR